jgi:hypothetical protein
MVSCSYLVFVKYINIPIFLDNEKILVDIKEKKTVIYLMWVGIECVFLTVVIAIHCRFGDNFYFSNKLLIRHTV